MSRQEWGTPRAVFDQLHWEYNFTIDIAANNNNRKLGKYCCEHDLIDGLRTERWVGERVWCNPPYNNIKPWLMLHHESKMSCYLLPARVDTEWWHHFKPIAECHYFRGRMQFEPPDGVQASSNPFASCLFLFGKGSSPGKEAWRCAKTGLRL